MDSSFIVDFLDSDADHHEAAIEFILTLLEVVIETGRVRDVLAEARTAAGESHWVLTLGQSDDEVAETLVLAFEL